MLLLKQARKHDNISLNFDVGFGFDVGVAVWSACEKYTHSAAKIGTLISKEKKM
jgi:hypothetical protein